MFTGAQGACAIAVTAVNTNRQAIMRAGLRTGVTNLYFLFEVIISKSFLLVFVDFRATGFRIGRSGEGQSATLMPQGKWG
jgi:hypothetical protein